MRKAEEVGSIYIIANDPDADRLAVAELVDGTWRIFNGNEIGAILAWWQLQVHLAKHGESGYKRENLYYIASTVSSKMLGALAKKEGLVFEVLQLLRVRFY
jgi:phosphomannomutase